MGGQGSAAGETGEVRTERYFTVGDLPRTRVTRRATHVLVERQVLSKGNAPQGEDRYSNQGTVVHLINHAIRRVKVVDESSKFSMQCNVHDDIIKFILSVHHGVDEVAPQPSPPVRCLLCIRNNSADAFHVVLEN